MPTGHSLKLKGQFAISSELQHVATRHGLFLERVGRDQYIVHGTAALDAVCPDFIERDRNRFDGENLKRFLEFLHQPIRASAPQKDRKTIHRIFRFMQSGSTHIPTEEHQELTKQTAECHADTEQAMRDEDAWNTNPEIGNTKATISSLPGTEFDSQHGFTFATPEHDLKGTAQQELQKIFWEIIDKVTDERYLRRPKHITLSANELNTLCQHLKTKGFDHLIDRATFEEAYQTHTEAIKTRATNITIRENAYSADHLRQLMKATTALTPLLNSEEMRKIWARYHVTERKNAPHESIAHEFEIMHAVMNEYAQRDDLSDADIESITLEFYSLLAFAKDMATLLGEEQIAKTIQNANTKNISLSDRFMSENHRGVIDSLQRHSKQGKSMFKRLARAGWDTTKDFALDVINFIRESPKTATAFVGLATTLYMMNGGDSEAIQAVNDTIMTFGDTGLEAVTIDPDSLPEEAKTSQSWHWDMGPFGLYKHYMYDNAVVGPAQTMMDWVRMSIQGVYDATGIDINPDPAFSQAAEETSKALADQLFKVNLFQNFSHAAFWMYMSSRGFNHGFKGSKRVFELLSPLTDMGYSALIQATDIATFNKRTKLSGMLGGNTTQPKTQHETLHALGEAAQAREAFIPPTLKKKGLSFDFQVCAEHAQGMIDALQEFDTVLEHIADKIGIEDAWYQKFLQEKIKQATASFKQFRIDQNEARLKNALDEPLTDIVGAQIRHTGQTNIATIDDKTKSRLCSTANATYGRMKRAHKIENSKSTLVQAGTGLWDSLVRTARVAQSYSNLRAVKPAVIATAGALAASVGLDMAGYENSIASALSAFAGTLTSSAVTTGTFLVYNFGEDVLGVHVGSGAALLGAGALTGHLYRKTVKPVTLAALEPL